MFMSIFDKGPNSREGEKRKMVKKNKKTSSVGWNGNINDQQAHKNKKR